MKLKIRKIELTNFKGIQHKKIELDGTNVKICGVNGSGKTTVFDAVMYVFCNCNSRMVSNPPVTPVEVPECQTSVEIECLLDDKPLKVARNQKYKEKKDPDSGKITATTTSNYSINDVEYNQTNFIKELTNRGIDLENFLYLSHPEAFTADVSAKGREKIRAILFGMIENIFDADIANQIEVPELKALLEQGYSIQEIDSMSKSGLRKINEQYGRSNELIDARISGIIQSKSQIDVKAVEKQKSEYESELEQVRTDYTNLRNADNKAEAKIAELEGELLEIERKSQKEIEEKNAALSEKARKAQQKARDIQFEMTNAKASADQKYVNAESVKESRDHYREVYKQIQNEVFDEESLKCPTCGREYAPEDQENMRKSFETGKAERLASCEKMGKMFSLQYDGLKGEYDDFMAEYEKKHAEWLKADSKASELAEKYTQAASRPDLSKNKEYQKIKTEIEQLRKSLGQTDAFKIQELSNRESYLIQMIKQADAELTLFERNKDLDNDIKALREEKRQAEIQRAKNEKLIDQVKSFTQKKNDLLTSKINEKFSMVEWHLYEYQKNGEIKPVCEPYIDGKPMTSVANGSLITLAKISICADLQKQFSQNVPIWVEDYSLFSKNTESRINVDTQIIGLVVTEDKELRVEHE